MSEEKKRPSESSEKDKEDIETLGLSAMSDAGFSRLSEGRKPKDEEKERKPFIGFS